MNQDQNQRKNQKIHVTSQQLVHELLDLEADYALKVNALAERWIATTLSKSRAVERRMRN